MKVNSRYATRLVSVVAEPAGRQPCYRDFDGGGNLSRIRAGESLVSGEGCVGCRGYTAFDAASDGAGILLAGVHWTAEPDWSGLGVVVSRAAGVHLASGGDCVD